MSASEDSDGRCIVTVEFRIAGDRWQDFLTAVGDQARTSLAMEPACQVFDVVVAADGEPTVFLYEVYDDRAAFDAHLTTPHFLAFDARVRDWTLAKTVQIWSPAP